MTLTKFQIVLQIRCVHTVLRSVIVSLLIALIDAEYLIEIILKLQTYRHKIDINRRAETWVKQINCKKTILPILLVGTIIQVFAVKARCYTILCKEMSLKCI